jgi:hypothetical protein
LEKGEAKKRIAPAASSTVPARPSGIRGVVRSNRSPGMPRAISESPRLIFSSLSLGCVRRVSMRPKATALTWMLNWPHSFASVFVSPMTPALPDE